MSVKKLALIFFRENIEADYLHQIRFIRQTDTANETSQEHGMVKSFPSARNVRQKLPKI